MHHAVYRLGPGKYDVRVAVIDPLTERVGAARLEVELTDAPGEWRVSDPWLGVQGPNESLAPVVEGRVSAGEAVVAYVEVYNGVTPLVSGRILPGGTVDDLGPAEETFEVTPSDKPTTERRGPAVRLTAVSGIHRGTIPLTQLPAGRYVLEFRIEDVGAGRATTVRLLLEVVPHS